MKNNVKNNVHYELTLLACIALVALVSLVSVAHQAAIRNSDVDLTGDTVYTTHRTVHTTSLSPKEHAVAVEKCTKKGGNWIPIYGGKYSIGRCGPPRIDYSTPKKESTTQQDSSSDDAVTGDALRIRPRPSTTLSPEAYKAAVEACKAKGGLWLPKYRHMYSVGTCQRPPTTATTTTPPQPTTPPMSPVNTISPPLPVTQPTQPIPAQPCTPKCTSECGGENDNCGQTCAYKPQGTSCTSTSILQHQCNGKGGCVMKTTEVELQKFQDLCIKKGGKWTGISNQVEHPVSRTNKISPCDCLQVSDYTHPTYRYYPDLYLGCIPWV